MSLNCIYCKAQFNTRSKRDSHMVAAHVSNAQGDELTVSRNSDGFPCPCCKRCYKTAKTLKDHLAKKQLGCMYIYDLMTDAGPQLALLKFRPLYKYH